MSVLPGGGGVGVGRANEQEAKIKILISEMKTYFNIIPDQFIRFTSAYKPSCLLCRRLTPISIA